MDNPPTPPQAPAPAEPPKKGLHPLIWVAIGCGALALLALVLVMGLGFFMVRKVKENVSTHDGKMVIKTEKGEVSVSSESGAQAKLPDWLPAYPGGTAKGSYTTKAPDMESVMCMWVTSDPPAKVQQFYLKALQDAGLKVTTISSGAEAGCILTAQDKSGKRNAQVVVAVEQGKTAVNVTCQTKNAPDE